MQGLGSASGNKQAVRGDRAARCGSVTVICGCMFSGKTTVLLGKLAGLSRESALLFKHVIDRRYQPDAVVSHDGASRPATPIASVDETRRHVRPGVEIVAFDEAHFFGVELVDVVRKLADSGIRVIVTSLDRDSWGHPFPVATRLRELADTPIDRRAVCARCGAAADRTQRLTPIVDGVMVGGPESYEARCEKCWTPPPEAPPKEG